ncbi:MAG TPA: TfoX/Sxy family protein [bacterium]|nr:TfoX/Sxy family protein [bacterium]
MSYDQGVVDRVRKALSKRRNVAERRMFGGLTFMVGGHMTCGVVGDELMVRVGPDAYAEALKDRHAREMDFTGTPLKGFVFVESKGFATEEALREWLDRAVEFVKTLPVK